MTRIEGKYSVHELQVALAYRRADPNLKRAINRLLDLEEAWEKEKMISGVIKTLKDVIGTLEDGRALLVKKENESKGA